jgi:hypothetical protein
MCQADSTHPMSDRVRVLKRLPKPLRDYMLSALVLPIAKNAARHEATVLL